MSAAPDVKADASEEDTRPVDRDADTAKQPGEKEDSELRCTLCGLRACWTK